jgi:hypothetical protein
MQARRNPRPCVVLGVLAAGVLASAASFILLPSCLYTASPLARAVRPNTTIVDAGGGIGLAGSSGITGGGWAYWGFTAGSHWELGGVVSGGASSAGLFLAVAFPVRWDPFPQEWPVHLMPFVAPLVGVDSTGVVPWFLVGAALTVTLAKGVELFGAVDYSESLSGYLGIRAAVTPDLSLSAALDLNNAGLSAAPPIGLSIGASWMMEKK